MDRKTSLTLFVFCILKLALHLIADNNSGFQGDEFLHIETGNNLAFGYMEFPPVIGVLAFFQNLFQSESVFVHHLFPHISAILILLFVSKITIELGGKSKAVFLVLTCIIIAPAFGRSQQLFQPVVFSQLLWVINFYTLTKYTTHFDKRILWYLTLSTALAFLTKYDAVFFIIGLSSLLFFKSTRRSLVEHKFWQNIVVFLLIISPNIIWQVVNDLPVYEMYTRLLETQLERQEPLEVIQGLFMALNPLALLITIPALFSMFHHSMKPYRPLSVTILISIICLAFSKGKGYYFYPIALTVLPFGAVFLESYILTKRKWLIYPFGVVFSVGVLLIPFGMPVFPLASYLKHDYPYENREVIERGQFNVNFEERYSKKNWSIILKELKNVHDSLPDKERNNCMIWGKHYAQAGAVSLFKDRYDLPEVFSLHGSFYNWVPKGNMPETTICLSYNVGRFFKAHFEEVIMVRTFYNPYAETEAEQHQHIYICKKPKQKFNELKKIFEERIFE